MVAAWGSTILLAVLRFGFVMIKKHAGTVRDRDRAWLFITDALLPTGPHYSIARDQEA